MKPLIASLLLFLVMGTVHAQSNNLLIEGSVYGTKGLPLKDVEIKVLDEEGGVMESMTTSPNGRFKFEFGFDRSIDIIYSKPDHQSKRVVINTKDVPAEAKQWGYEFGNIRVILSPGSDKAEPELAAKVSYSVEDENFTHAQ